MEHKMNVYIYRYGSICEPDIIDSLKRLNCSVYEEIVEVTNKNLTPSECVKIVSPQLLNNNYSFVFTINFFPWISDLCKIINIPYISLIVDSPLTELYYDSLANNINRVFMFDKEMYNEFVHINPSHIFHIPLAANVIRIQDTINNSSEEVKQKYKSDISFIGSTYQEKCLFNTINLPEREMGYANGLIEAQLKVYGYNFIADCIDDNFIQTFLKYNPQIYNTSTGFKPDYKNIIALQYISVKAAEQERIRTLKYMSDLFNVDIYTRSDTSHMPNANNKGFAKSHEEMPLIFNQSKINLNITAKSIRSGLSQRIFDVLASGGFLITNYQSEIPEIFEDGKDLVMYSDINQLRDLCSYYLEHEEERISIAQNGFNKVKELHNYDIRMFQIIEKSFGQSE